MVAGSAIAAWHHNGVSDGNKILDCILPFAGYRTCDLQVTGLSPGWAPLRSGFGQAVAKQYNSVPAKGGDIFCWESNRGPDGK